mmetsp:Transcript_20951/g.51198  ORF Transcript_20951/g.51198 Transcript_20951/m.51198 type:complete len:100 (-) Transcript_20951:152-451(-)
MKFVRFVDVVVIANFALLPLDTSIGAGRVVLKTNSMPFCDSDVLGYARATHLEHVLIQSRIELSPPVCYPSAQMDQQFATTAKAKQSSVAEKVLYQRIV